ncbi:hypothetical protein MB901379_03186 [Mycobacterium basiliense]|uniref:Uncharacterized protein n=1 Tax=Mycobacterium basiliense TaxID=2094119 RepID=A0A3S5CZX1_9MYCO|nr:hypothetical protein [Mycobacterium basiliense]VDM89608.1 hypothetical protein MB901379_03186 [Mycobacterium basiliense]
MDPLPGSAFAAGPTVAAMKNATMENAIVGTVNHSMVAKRASYCRLLSIYGQHNFLELGHSLNLRRLTPA